MGSNSDQGAIIAGRSVSLSKTFPVVGIFLAVVGLALSSLSVLVGSLPTSGSGSSGNFGPNLTFLAVPLQSLAAITFATPVLLLFVYDKNNGVLEYFLSLGMNQRDIYRQYLEAALMLASFLVASVVVMDMVAGLLEGKGQTMVEISGLVVAISLSSVSLSSIIMMSFSSLQKQRVGSNQPLGMAIGVFIVMPSYLFALVIPKLALEIDLLLAGVIVVLSLVTYFASGRMISREKLLP